MIVTKKTMTTSTKMMMTLTVMMMTVIIVVIMDGCWSKGNSFVYYVSYYFNFLLFTADYYSFHGRIPFGYSPLINSYSYATGSAIPGLVRPFRSFISNLIKFCRPVDYEFLNQSFAKWSPSPKYFAPICRQWCQLRTFVILPRYKY